jgi:hypothetical protein
MTSDKSEWDMTRLFAPAELESLTGKYLRRSFSSIPSSHKSMQRHLGRMMLWLSLLLLLLSNRIPLVCSGQEEQEDAMVALEQCRLDLVAADTNRTDGYLTLWEYEAFVNQRYYTDCAARVSVTVAQSVSQWQAFTQLACFTCLEEWSTNNTSSSAALTALPDCCLPFNNSRIAIYGLNSSSSGSSSSSSSSSAAVSSASSWLARTCDTADAAAVADQCYTARPTIPTETLPSLSPIVVVGGGSDSSDSDNAVLVPQSLYTDCTADLVMADVDASGTLDRVEFDALLQLHALAMTATSITHTATTSDSNNSNSNSNGTVTVNCIVTQLESVVTAAYAALVCASCLWNTATTATTTTALDISCCTNGKTGSSSTGISILGAASPMALRTESERVWIQRLCLAATALVECTITAVAPIAPSPATAAAPVSTTSNSTNGLNVTVNGTMPAPSPTVIHGTNATATTAAPVEAVIAPPPLNIATATTMAPIVATNVTLYNNTAATNASTAQPPTLVPPPLPATGGTDSSVAVSTAQPRSGVGASAPLVLAGWWCACTALGILSVY